MGDEDRAGYLDRDKKSFSELDRMRRDGGDGSRGAAAEQRSEQASKEYRKQLDGLFSSGDAAEHEGLATALLDARGTPGLAEACRAYQAAVGLPTQLRQISCFLDSDALDVLLAGLAAARGAHEAQTLEASAGLRTQLRMLADHADDAVAEAAEALLEDL
ncbi:MAG: hypothetical protein JRH16_20445 [Deltaproteobacteria bacterium]|nr:hypothetical protein [Deltaproteobacteria bacterium]MBW2362774.1 hypothetical protein [Deltaproteobacteria bacterium]